MATDNFTDEELSCNCGCGGLPPEEFQEILQELRESYGHPMRISSGYRCPDHNERVSKTGRDGPHTQGAVDVLCSGIDAWQLVDAAMAEGWTGIGVSQRGPHESRFVHLDKLENDTRPWVWSY